MNETGFRCRACGRTKRNEAIRDRDACWYCGDVQPRAPKVATIGDSGPRPIPVAQGTASTQLALGLGGE